LKAQVSLTPTESKKLIAKAVVQMPEFRRAFKRGIIVIHPSTTTTFIYEELFKRKPKGVIVSGVVLQKGTCISMQSIKHMRKNEYFRKGPEEFRLWVIMSGELQKGLKLGVVSNGFKKDVEHVLEKLGLKKWFDVVVSIDSCNSAKPAKEIFFYALNKLGVQPYEVLFIGDSVETDYKGAVDVGIKSFIIDREGKIPSQYDKIETLTDLLTIV